MTARRWQWAALALALLAGLFWAFAPVVSESWASGSSSPSGGRVVDSGTRHLSLLQSEGPSVLPALLTPVLLTALPLPLSRCARAVAVGCAVLLLLFVLAALFSVGVGYLPSLALAVVAVVRGTPGRARRPRQPAVADAPG